MIPENVREFYAREYERIGAELVENESMGEGRVALYLGVWSVALASVAAMATATSPPEAFVSSVVLAGLSVVLLLGVVTTSRVVKRNFHTDELIDSLSRIRQLLSPEAKWIIPSAMPWNDDISLTRPRRPVLLHAGLLHVLCLANAVTVTLGLVVVLQTRTSVAAVIGVLAASVLAHFPVFYYCNNRAAGRRLRKGTAFREQQVAVKT